MVKKISNDEEIDENEELFKFLRVFLKRHEKPIGNVLEAWAKNVEKEPDRRLSIFKWILGLTTIITTIIGFLTWQGVVSSDAFTFLIGSILGYILTFLRNMFVGGNR